MSSLPRKKRSRPACAACGFPSYHGRVCRGCRKFYGGDAANAIAGAALARKIKEWKSFDDIFNGLAAMFDVIVYDWPPPLGPKPLPQLLHSRDSAI